MSDQELPQEDFDKLAELARGITHKDRVRHQPPADLWDKISNGIASDAEDVAPHQPEYDPAVIDLSERRQQAPLISETVPFEAGSTESRPFAKLLAVAAAVVLVVVGASIGITTLNSDPNVVYAADISNADLPEAFDGSASVTLEIDDAPMIMIDFDSDLPTDEPLEIWILNADGSEIIPVGTVESGDTSWDWPEGFSPDEYPLVDISVEPDDGDASHSGRSILRGELTIS